MGESLKVGSAMSLRKSPILTPARLAANRRNAQKSTGPLTPRGKAQSRMNSLRGGWYSPTYRKLLRALLEAPICAIDLTARAILAPEQAKHPVFAAAVNIVRQAEFEIVRDSILRHMRAESRKMNADRGLAKPECS